MSINGINSTSALNAPIALDNTSKTDGTGRAPGTASTPASSTTVSKPGELMAKLSQLQQQDPAKFKQVAAQISDDLKAAASSANGPQAAFLSKLSDDLAQASTSGNMDSLKPPSGGEHAGAAHHHHGGGHHGGGGGGVDGLLSHALSEVNQALNSTTTSNDPPVAVS